MGRFGVDEVVAIVRREVRAREERERHAPAPTLFDDLAELHGLARAAEAHGRWAPGPEWMALAKRILRALGLYEAARAWWKSR